MAVRRAAQSAGAVAGHGNGWGGLARAIASLGQSLSGGLAGLAEQRVGVSAPHARPSTHAMLRPSDMFVQGLRENSNLEMDWLWLASRVSSQSERRYCLERALAINPRSSFAREELAALGK
jgi:hypothetical protein